MNSNNANLGWFSGPPWSCLRPQSWPRPGIRPVLGQLARRQWSLWRSAGARFAKFKLPSTRPDLGPRVWCQQLRAEDGHSAEWWPAGQGDIRGGVAACDEWWPASATSPSPSPPPWSTLSPGPSSSRSSSSSSCLASRTATGTAPGK